jgi:hypothetical protein
MNNHNREGENEIGQPHKNISKVRVERTEESLNAKETNCNGNSRPSSQKKSKNIRGEGRKQETNGQSRYLVTVTVAVSLSSFLFFLPFRRRVDARLIVP